MISNEMSILEKIENLHRKPEAVRRRILYVSVTVVMFLIVAVWVSTLKFSLLDNKKDINLASPFSVMKNILTEGYNLSFGAIKEGFKGSEKAYAK